MDAPIEAVDGDKVLKFKKFLLEEGGNDIIADGPQNLIHAFSDTIGEGYGSNRGKEVIELSTGEVPVPPATGNDILLDSDILLESNEKKWMHYVVSDPEHDAVDGTRETMGVTFTLSKKG